MNYKLIILFLVILSSCLRQQQLNGSYTSKCVIYDSKPELVIYFYSNDSFQYFLSFLVDTIKGNWTKKYNKIYLSSTFFSKKCYDTLGLCPKYNFSPNPNDTIDCFRLKRNKLCSISKNNRNGCCLIKEK